MKKFMMMIVVAASAGLLQAAAIAWNAGGGSGLGSEAYIYAMTGTAADKAAVELLLAAGDVAGFQSYYAGLVDVYTYAGELLGSNSNVALGAGVTGGSIPGGLANTNFAPLAPQVFEGLSAQGVFYVIFDNADPLAADLYSVSQRFTPTVPSGSGTSAPVAGSWANWGGTGVSGSTTWQDVPEPTAMALLALGAAALGLRRRFRK